jgi:hypothetical protein
MAKDKYYSQDEAMKRLALGKTQIANLVRDGKMREFRIEGQTKYKVDDIDALAAEINPMVGSGMDESSTDGASESAIELLPVDATDGGTDAISLEETGDHLVPAPPSKEDTVITPAGVSVFDEDELAGMDADPMAKTQIAPSVTDELSIEGGGGSGLMDMTRESDDTSLGAELLDEIYSGDETQPDKAPPPEVGGQGEAFGQIEEPAVRVPRMVVQVDDPFGGLFTGLVVVAVVLLGFAGLVGAGLVVGTLPGFIGQLASIWFIWPIIAVVVTAIGLGLGYVLGKQTTA